LCNVASCWIYIGILLEAHPILHISRLRVNYWVPQEAGNWLAKQAALRVPAVSSVLMHHAIKLKLYAWYRNWNRVLNVSLRAAVLPATEFSVPGGQEAGWYPKPVWMQSMAPVKRPVAVIHQVRLLMQNYSKTVHTARNITAVNTVGLWCISPEQTELFTSTSTI
jgi:hypothetical protein